MLPLLSPVLLVVCAYGDETALTMAIGDVLMTLGSTLPIATIAVLVVKMARKNSATVRLEHGRRTPTNTDRRTLASVAPCMSGLPCKAAQLCW